MIIFASKSTSAPSNLLALQSMLRSIILLALMLELVEPTAIPSDTPSEIPSSMPSFPPSGRCDWEGFSLLFWRPKCQWNNSYNPVNGTTVDDLRELCARANTQDECEAIRYPYSSYSSVQCFPSSSTVERYGDDGPVRMEDLRVGDKVMTGEGTYSIIYAFGHKDAGKDTIDYYELRGSDSTVLHLSSDHILPLNGKMRFAKEAASGMTITLKDNVQMVLQSVNKVHMQGRHAPYTHAGTIVVDGVVASCYAVIPSFSLGPIFISGHHLAKTIFAPLRYVSFLYPVIGKPEWHSGDGQHRYQKWLLHTFGTEVFVPLLFPS